MPDGTRSGVVRKVGRRRGLLQAFEASDPKVVFAISEERCSKLEGFEMDGCSSFVEGMRKR